MPNEKAFPSSADRSNKLLTTLYLNAAELGRGVPVRKFFVRHEAAFLRFVPNLLG
jgi:hypothetical protein